MDAFTEETLRKWVKQTEIDAGEHDGLVIEELRRFVEALNMALWRRTPPSAELVHHYDRGDRYTPVEFSKRLKEAGLLASMGSVGDALVL